VGPGLGGLAERHGGDAVHLLPAGRRHRLQAHHGRDHLRAWSGWRCTCRASTSVDLPGPTGLSYGDVYHQNEVEQSAYNFEHSDVDFLLGAFVAHERQAKALMQAQLALPAYEQVLKAAHSFNLLDARGAISVTERAAYIGRIRALARSVAQSYLESRARFGFPMAKRDRAEEVLSQLAARTAATRTL
jgi:hypothetical protein